MGIAPRSYEEYFPSDSFTVSGVQSQPFAAPMALPEYDPIADELADQQALAQQEIRSGNTDWSSDAGRGKLQNFVARGVIPPAQAKTILSAIPRSNRYSSVPLDVAKATNQLAQINPSDPEAWNTLQKTISPDVIGLDVQSHPAFQTELKELRNQILTQQTHREVTGRHDPNQEIMSKAMQAGMEPDELRQFMDENGKVADKLGLQNAIFQAGQAPRLDNDLSKHISALQMSAILPPTQDDKETFLSTQGIDPKSATPQQWQAAWYGARQAKQQAFNEIIGALKAQGYRKLPKEIQLIAPQAPQQTEQPPQINSQAEYNALPSGAVYVDSHGRVARKR